MSISSQLDCLTWQSLDFPYNTIQRELSEQPRLVAGSQNTAVTLGGKLVKRPGTIGIPGTAALPAGSRIDRLWVYETLDTPSHVYIVASVAIAHTPTALPLLFTSPTVTWRLYYCNLSASTFWSLAPELRGSNESLRPHEGAVSRGLLFLKGFPSKTLDVLGSVILDGTSGALTTKPWGALGPTTPAAIVGLKTLTTAAVTTTTVLINVPSTATFPAAPFNIQIDWEEMTVTAVAPTQFTVIRAAQGTVAAVHVLGANVLYLPWSATAHPTVVNIGWTYSYAYETITGNVTNRVDIQRNPDSLPSFTGPILNLIPQLTLQGLADTTNYPFIRVFRTTDGGGTFFQLERIPNPGGGSFTYFDKSLVSSAGLSDPVPDSQLDANIISPTLISNSPPPSVITPGVIGVDAVSPATPIAYYQGRFWYAIGNILFYSGEEEITLGVPEECWPAGTLGNFFRYQHPIVNVQATSNALYIITIEDTHVITGNNRLTFNSNPIFQTIGAPYGHPRAITRYGESVAWLANDFRVVYAQGSTLFSVSDELGTDLSNAIQAGAEVDIKYWANLDKEYIVVLAVNQAAPSLTREWIFDIKKSTGGQARENFWYSPWNIPATCLASGRINDTAAQRSLIFANVSGTSTFLSTYDTTGVAAVDTTPSGSLLQRYDCVMISALFGTPAGNHINALRKPDVAPNVEFIQVDRTSYASDQDPEIFWYKDDVWTDPLPLPTGELPDFRTQSKGYVTYKYNVSTVAQRMAFKIQKLASPDRFELQNIFVAFKSTLGS